MRGFFLGELVAGSPIDEGLRLPSSGPVCGGFFETTPPTSSPDASQTFGLLRPPINQAWRFKVWKEPSVGVGIGGGGLEPTESEDEGFTVPCNCRYATPPRRKIAGERN